MNREQRRAAERKRPQGRQHRVDPSAAWDAMKIAMVKTHTCDLNEDSKRDLLTPTYLCVQRLQFGTLDYEDFVHLCEMNSVAGEIAYQMQFHDQSGQITNAGFGCLAAAEALHAIGLRRQAKDRYVATGDELKTIRDAVQYLSDLFDLAPSGVIVAALDKMRRLVDKRTGRVSDRVQLEVASA